MQHAIADATKFLLHFKFTIRCKFNCIRAIPRNIGVVVLGVSVDLYMAKKLLVEVE